MNKTLLITIIIILFLLKISKILDIEYKYLIIIALITIALVSDGSKSENLTLEPRVVEGDVVITGKLTVNKSIIANDINTASVNTYDLVTMGNSLTLGNQQQFDIADYTTVECDDDPNRKYRYLLGKGLQLYPSDNIANTYDEYKKSRQFKLRFCNKLHGPDVQINPNSLQNNLSIPSGSLVKCTDDIPADKDNIYRYTTNDGLQLFPSPEILQSWNPNPGRNMTGHITETICNGIPKSKPMTIKDGSTILCRDDNNLLYRYDETTNKIKRYTNPEYAQSWNPRWNSNPLNMLCNDKFIKDGYVDLKDGTTIKCENTPDKIYRYTKQINKLQPYTTVDIANSYGSEWNSNVVTVPMCNAGDIGPDLPLNPNSMSYSVTDHGIPVSAHA